MTENQPVTSVHRARTTRALALCLALVPVGAAADVWNVFQRFCLTPLEATESPLTDAFEWIYEDDEIDVHLLEIDDLSITINIYKDGTFTPVGCEMHVNSDASWTGLDAGFQAWRERVLSDQSYTPSEDGNSLLSTDQREPLIRVFSVGPDQVPTPFIAVEETHLES